MVKSVLKQISTDWKAPNEINFSIASAQLSGYRIHGFTSGMDAVGYIPSRLRLLRELFRPSADVPGFKSQAIETLAR